MLALRCSYRLECGHFALQLTGSNLPSSCRIDSRSPRQATFYYEVSCARELL
jgi:hypothetical protein